MRILYINGSRLPTEKAQGYQVMKMAEAFARDHQVLLIYPARKNMKELRLVTDIFAYYAVNKKFALKRVFCLDLRILHRMRLFNSWFWTYSMSYSLRLLL